MILRFLVDHQTLTREDEEQVVADSRNYLKCGFTFQTSDWNGVTKIATFRNGETVKKCLVQDDEICEVPREVIKAPGFYVSLAGGNLIPTNEARIRLIASAVQYEDTENPLTESLYDQLIASFTQKTTAAESSAFAAAQSADEAKESELEAEAVLEQVQTMKRGLETFSDTQKAEIASMKAETQTAANNAALSVLASQSHAQTAENAAWEAKSAKISVQDVLEEVQTAGTTVMGELNQIKNDVRVSQEDVRVKHAQTAVFAKTAANKVKEADTAREAARQEAQNAAQSAAVAAQTAKEITDIHTDIKARQADVTAKHGEVEADRAEVEQNTETTVQAKEAAQQTYSDFLNQLGTDVPTLVGGKIPMSQIPATATQEIYQVSSADELTGLIAQRGDLAELIETIDGEKTVTKTWQCLGDASIRDNWIVWGTSYAVQAGNAATAANAENANTINHHRIVTMTAAEFETAVKDENTLYLVGDFT